MTKPKKRKRNRMIRCGFVLAITIIGYIFAQAYALRWRGYSAIGGEHFLFIIPILYLFGEVTAEDIRIEREKIEREEMEENG